MVSNVDKLLLTSAQQAELERLTRAYQQYQAAGDTAGMNAAHRRAEELRASAGYSGGEDGDQYRLLKTAGSNAGYNGYEALIEKFAGSGMNAIAAGYADQLEQLDRQRDQINAQSDQNQAAARSAAWNQQRLAADGLLTRGVSNTGLADIITATALNQAAANAYQALLDRQEDLEDNDAARSAAHAEALGEAADLQAEIGKLLGDAYSNFYTDEADRNQQILLQQMKQDASLEQSAKDYYYELAMQKLKRQWELQDQARGY